MNLGTDGREEIAAFSAWINVLEKLSRKLSAADPAADSFWDRFIATPSKPKYLAPSDPWPVTNTWLFGIK
jgi:hypothetical protein